MCGRFVSATDVDGLVRFFVVDERKADELPPSYNVAPTDRVYAVAAHDGRRVLTTFRWGLVPAWAPAPTNGARAINARAETIASKPTFRDAFRARRCLVPADGFYEWRREGDRKTPHYIRHRTGDPLALAGVWSVWRDRRDPSSRLLTCAIVTTAADEPLLELHDRMPVVVGRDRWAEWLDPASPDDALHEILRGAEAAELVHHAVGDAVNRVANNDASLVVARADVRSGTPAPARTAGR